MIIRPKPIDEEIFFNGRSLITETDTRGIITFVNRKFVEMTGYSKEEAIGEPHNILRHPDMPKVGFKQMWDTVKSGKIWEGYVKNLRKDGRYYWVIVHIVPKIDDAGNITGYIASRKMPDPQKLRKIELEYKILLDLEKG
jgi:aerotaxis receptor